MKTIKSNENVIERMKATLKNEHKESAYLKYAKDLGDGYFKCYFYDNDNNQYVATMGNEIVEKLEDSSCFVTLIVDNNGMVERIEQ